MLKNMILNLDKYKFTMLKNMVPDCQVGPSDSNFKKFETWTKIQETFIQIGGENLDTVFQRAAGAIFNLQNLTCTDLKVRAMSMEGRADKV